MTSTTPPTIDWVAAEVVAKGLGLVTRSLVAADDADQAIAWALQMSKEHVGVAALSYYELAVMLGHRDPKVTAGASLDWNELLRAVETLAGSVRAKVDAGLGEKYKAAAKKKGEQLADAEPPAA